MYPAGLIRIALTAWLIYLAWINTHWSVGLLFALIAAESEARAWRKFKRDRTPKYPPWAMQVDQDNDAA
jgi:hypothetical protein